DGVIGPPLFPPDTTVWPSRKRETGGNARTSAHAEDPLPNHQAIRVVAIRVARGRQHHSLANSGIAVNDGAAEAALAANAQGRPPRRAVGRDPGRSLISAGPQHDDVFEGHIRLNPGAASEDASDEVGIGHETAFPTNDLVEDAVREVGRWQVAGVGV